VNIDTAMSKLKVKIARLDNEVTTNVRSLSRCVACCSRAHATNRNSLQPTNHHHNINRAGDKGKQDLAEAQAAISVCARARTFAWGSIIG